MQQLLLTISSLCMIAALCEQLLQGRRYFRSVRLVLGIQIAAVFVDGICTGWQLLNA